MPKRRKLRFGFVNEEISLNKRATVVEILFLARLLAEIDHHFGDVDADDFRRAATRELE